MGRVTFKNLFIKYPSYLSFFEWVFWCDVVGNDDSCKSFHFRKCFKSKEVLWIQNSRLYQKVFLNALLHCLPLFFSPSLTLSLCICFTLSISLCRSFYFIIPFSILLYFFYLSLSPDSLALTFLQKKERESVNQSGEWNYFSTPKT